jgi:DNA-binding CsgD family transcriptional regulator
MGRSVPGILSSREGALMPRRSPYRIELSHEERAVLESLARSYTLPYWLVIRARTVLMAAEGMRNDEIAARLGCGRRHEQIATPVEWKFTPADLAQLLNRVDQRTALAA